MSRNPHYISMIGSPEWRRLRAEKLRSNPLCETCEANGKSVFASEVHHVTPVESVPRPSDMRRLMFSYSNLQSLCHACHVEVHRLAFSHSKEAVQANKKRETQRFADRFLNDSSNQKPGETG